MIAISSSRVFSVGRCVWAEDPGSGDLRPLYPGKCLLQRGLGRVVDTRIWAGRSPDPARRRIRKPLLLVRIRTIRAPDDEDLMLTVGTRENQHNLRCREMSTQRSQPSSVRTRPAPQVGAIFR